MSTHPPENPRNETRPAPAPAVEKRTGLTFRRYFTKQGKHPYDEVAWETRSAVINDEKGQPVFEQHGIEVPTTWSQTATNIVASKYFRGRWARPSARRSVRKLIARVVDTIAGWAEQQGYFATAGRPPQLLGRADPPARAPEGGLQQPGLVQRRASRSTRRRRRASSTPSTTRWTRSSAWPRPRACSSSSARARARTSRASARRKEPLAGGGTASGPVSFMRGYDAFAGVIKSGGKTRRAAKMVILNADHPDIVEFITARPTRRRRPGR